MKSSSAQPNIAINIHICNGNMPTPIYIYSFVFNHVMKTQRTPSEKLTCFEHYPNKMLEIASKQRLLNLCFDA